jgi:hypothetical protein
MDPSSFFTVSPSQSFLELPSILSLLSDDSVALTVVNREERVSRQK